MKSFVSTLKWALFAGFAIASTYAAAECPPDRQCIDVINVTATTLGDLDLTGNSSGAIPVTGGGGSAPSQVCTNNASNRQFFGCDGKANSAPTSVDQLNIPYSDRSQVVWTPSALAFAQALYNGTSYADALPPAVASAISLCGNDTPCMNQALQFYGLQQFSPTLIPGLGQAAFIANWVRINFNPALGSPAKTFSQAYTDAQTCFLLNAERLANAC